MSALGIDNVGQQIFDVRPVRAREIGADVRAHAVQRMALLACFAEHGPAQIRIGRLLGLLRQQLAIVSR